MQTTIRLDAAAVSDRGLKRSTNEDSVLCDPPLGLFAVADGMGGHASGEVASRLAIETVQREWRAARQLKLTSEGEQWNCERLLGDVVATANHAVMERSHGCDLFAGMGTTLLVAVLHDMTLHYAHVGDSRLYRLRDEQLVLLTRDHTVAQWRLELGLCTEAEARVSAGAHRLTRAIGMDPECGVEVAACRCEPGDGYFLCSDGLNHELEDDAIARAWRSARRREDSADSLCRTLIDQANQAGGRDNISVLALHLRAQGRSTNQST
jgi:serine/threonine protein phosphatase PrpC